MHEKLRLQDVFEEIKKMALIEKNFVEIVRVCDREIDKIVMEVEAYEQEMEKKYQQHEEEKTLSNEEAIRQLATETNKFIMERFKK